MLSELMECSTQCALARRDRGGLFLRQIKRQQIEPKELIIMLPLRVWRDSQCCIRLAAPRA